MIGKKFGRLTVIDEFYVNKSGNRRKYFRCLCDCGNEVDIRVDQVKSGRAKSCGCFALESKSSRSKTHGMSSDRLYHIWLGMKARCYNENKTSYNHYGGRGIKVCERWHVFENFHMDMSESYQNHVLKYGESGTTIDRTDVNGDYEPKNCIWASMSLQAFNKRKGINSTSGVTGVSWSNLCSKWRAYITVDGKTRYLGYHEDFESAAKVRRDAEIKYYGFHPGEQREDVN
jgi:hypothetical protein